MKNNKSLKATNSIELKTQFCKNLKTIRHDIKLTQQQVADKMELPVSTYANWEQGRTEPSISDIFHIIKTLDIDANDLFLIN